MESWKADEKQIDEVKSEDEVESEERRCNSAKVRRKKIHPRQRLEKSRNAAFFQWFVCRVNRKVGSAAGAESCGQRRNQKLHAVVARSTFWSQNVQNTSGSERARRCGEKYILKSKCTKQVRFGALFEVQMSKNCTPLWREVCFEVKMLKNWHSQSTFWSSDVEKLHAAVGREAHFQVKMLKNWRSRSTFWSSDVEKLHAAVARSTFGSQNVQNTCVLPHFLKFRCRKIGQVVS